MEFKLRRVHAYEGDSMNQLQAEMKRIRDLLPTELFEGSKDWREGNTVERIEWLLSMYESSKHEVARLENLVEDMLGYFGDEDIK